MKRNKINAFLKAIVCGTISISFAPQLHGQIFEDQYGGSYQEVPAPALPMVEMEIPGSAYFVGPNGETIANPQQSLNPEIAPGTAMPSSVPGETIISEDPIYDGKKIFPLGTFPTQEFGERIISQTKVDENGETVEISGTLEAEAGPDESGGLENGVPVDEVIRPDSGDEVAAQTITPPEPDGLEDIAQSIDEDAPGMSVADDGKLADDQSAGDKAGSLNKGGTSKKSASSSKSGRSNKAAESKKAKSSDKAATSKKAEKNEEVEALRRALAKLDTRHDRLKDRLGEANLSIQKLQKSLASTSKLKDMAESKSAAHKAELEALTKEKSGKKSNSAKLEKEVDRLNKQLMAAKKSLAKTEEEIANNESAGATLTKEMGELLSAKKTATAGIAKLQKRYDSDTAKLKKQVQGLKSQLKTANGKVERAQEKSTKQISKLEKDLKSAESSSTDAIKAKEKQLAKQKEELESLNKQLATAESTLKANTEKSAMAVKNAQTKHKSQLKDIQKQLKSLEEQLAEEQAAAKKELEQVKKEKMAAQKSADQAASALAQLKSEIANDLKDSTESADGSEASEGEAGRTGIAPAPVQMPEVADGSSPKIESASPQESEKSEADLARERREAAEAAVKRKLAELEAKVKDETADTEKLAEDAPGVEVDGTLEVVPAALSLDDRIKVLKTKRDQLTNEAAVKIREKQQADIDKMIADGAAEDSDAVVAAKKELDEAIQTSKEKLKARYRRKDRKTKTINA